MANSSKFYNEHALIVIYYILGQPEKLPPNLVSFFMLFTTILRNIGNFDSLLNCYKSSNKLLLRSIVWMGRSLRAGITLIRLYFKSKILNLGVLHKLTASKILQTIFGNIQNLQTLQLQNRKYHNFIRIKRYHF
jgi:hypothetical protein